MSLPKETQPKRCPDKYLWLSVLLDRLMGWFPLLGRFGPMIAFSKAQTIFSRLLALCLFGMALMGVVRRQDGRFRFDDNIRQRDDGRVIFVVVGFQKYPNRLTGLHSRWCAGHDGLNDVTGAGDLVKGELAVTACRCCCPDVGRLLVLTEIHVRVTLTFVIASGTRFPAVRLLRLHLGHGVEQNFGKR